MLVAVGSEMSLQAPVRKAFGGQEAGHHAGWRDKSGHHFRCGPATFVWVAYSWPGTPMAGKQPARLVRNFGNEGDALLEYRQNVEILWCMNYAMLLLVSTEEELQCIPENIRTLMQQYPNTIYVETNWGSCEHWECVLSDCAVLPLTGGEIDLQTLEARLRRDKDLFVHAGTVTLNFHRKNPVGLASFDGWVFGASLESMLHDDFAGELPPCSEPAPRAADKYEEAAFEEVPLAGGPALGEDGAVLMCGASELRILGVSYQVDGETRYARLQGDLHSEVIDGVELLTHKQLGALATDATTLQLLAEPDLGERAWLNGSRELLPGYRRVFVRRSAISGQILTVNEGLAEELSKTMHPTEFYTFAAAVGKGGRLIPCRRVSDHVSAQVCRQLALPVPRPTQLLAQGALQEAIMQAAHDGRAALDPLVRTIMPFPYTWWQALGFSLLAQRAGRRGLSTKSSRTCSVATRTSGPRWASSRSRPRWQSTGTVS